MFAVHMPDVEAMSKGYHRGSTAASKAKYYASAYEEVNDL